MSDTSPPAHPISLSQSPHDTSLRPPFLRKNSGSRLKLKKVSARSIKQRPTYFRSASFERRNRSPTTDDTAFNRHYESSTSPTLSDSFNIPSSLIEDATFFDKPPDFLLVHLLNDLRLDGDGMVPISVAFSSSRFCIGCRSGDILIFDPISFTLLKRMSGHVRGVLSLSLLHNGPTRSPKLVSTSADGSLRIWNLDTFNAESVVVAADPGSLYGSAIDHVSGTMYLACQNASLQWFHEHTSNQSQARALFKTREFSYFFRPRNLGSFLTEHERTNNATKPNVYLIHDDQFIKYAHMGYIYAILTHPTLPKLYTGAGDGLVKIWNIANTKPQLTHAIHVHSGTVHVLDDNSSLCADLVGVDDPAVISLAISPNGSNLYVGCQRGTIMVWDLDTMQCVRRLVEHSDNVVSLHVISSVSGRNMANGDNVKSNGIPYTTSNGTNQHDHRLVSASIDGSIRVWALHDNYECLASINGINEDKEDSAQHRNPNALVSVALSNKRIAAIDTNARCLTWEAVGELITGESTYFTNERVASPLQKGSDLEVYSCSSSGASTPLMTTDIQLGIQLDPSAHMVEAMLFSLRNWIPYQTISGDPKFTYQCRAGAKYLKSVLSQLGADSVLLPGAEGRNPLVIGKFHAGRSKSPSDPAKHLIFYGHYDVVPVELKQWTSNPWELVGRNGYLYGRGVSDNKGPILSAIFAVAELSATNQLKATVTFIIEGEEESGSVGLREAIDNHPHLIFGIHGGADLILMSNSSWLGKHIPCLVYGQRGVVHVSVSVDGGDQDDRHAGVEGGVYDHEPLTDLVYLLAQLSDSKPIENQRNHRPVQIPGFYDTTTCVGGECLETVPLKNQSCSNQEINEYADLAARLIQEEDANVLKQLQGSLYTSTPTDTGDITKKLQIALVKKWLTPTLTISRITTSMGNQESKTVIPHRATANISLRTIPGQSTADLVDSLCTYLNEKYLVIQPSSPSSRNKIEIRVTTAADAWESNYLDPSFKSCASAIKRIWDCDPIYVREGGSTIPMYWLRHRLSGGSGRGEDPGGILPVVNVPLAQVHDRAHLSNESIRIENLIRGRLVLRECIVELQQV